MDQGNHKILVIDDEHSTLSMLRLLLRASGYTVLTADRGEKGLEIFRQEEPRIVLVDIRMPGMDGIEVLKRLKEGAPAVEVIVITGHGDMEIAIQALKHDASDFINKPIQKDVLHVALRRAEEKIRLKKQLEDYTHNLEAKVEEATAELAKSCRQLETLYEISQLVAEMNSLEGILELLQDKIHSITRLRCEALLVLNSQRNAIVCVHDHSQTASAGDELVATIKDLGEPRLLSGEERQRIFLSTPEPETEKVLILPIFKKDEPTVGAALVSLPPDEPDDELRLVTFLLSQAAGAIRRAVLQEEELRALRQIVEVREQFGDLIGRHEKMEETYKLVANVADSDATVLIQGESGTGKEVIARRIHELSSRREGPFVVINCAAYPQTLLESELFGHEKGAFTGATYARKGSFELAHGGTIFLDEVGEIPTEAQVKLLRVLQFMEFQRLGSETPMKVDVRVLAATSKNLRQEIEQDNFREDLYYRLHVIPITVPPLRERMSDLPLLAAHFLGKFSKRSDKKVLDIDPRAMNILMNYYWPGNIRELENVMEHACILAKGESVHVSELPAYLQETAKGAKENRQSLEEVEKRHLLKILKQCQGNKNQAARRLQISRSTLYRKLEHYGLLE
ncbi:MAG: sigma 54-interacting transcriptional regulator [Syntrophobacteria bacterium]